MLVESALLHAAKGTPAALVTDRCMGQGIFFLYISALYIVLVTVLYVA